tara:strand:- start:717 stop:1352 length:636 start_codon:yes stop_codon:yes gene_type:complete
MSSSGKTFTRSDEDRRKNAILAKNDKDRRCISDYVQYLSFPGSQYDEHAFFTKGALLIEQEIKEFLASRNRRTNKDFFTLIGYAKKLHKDDNLWDAVHNIRQLRNLYSHDLKGDDQKEKLIDDFIEHGEKVTGFDGKGWFGMSDQRNRRAFRAYFIFTLIWQELCRLNGASEDFDPARSWLDEYIDTMLAIAGKTREELFQEQQASLEVEP